MTASSSSPPLRNGTRISCSSMESASGPSDSFHRVSTLPPEWRLSRYGDFPSVAQVAVFIGFSPHGNECSTLTGVKGLE